METVGLIIFVALFGFTIARIPPQPRLPCDHWFRDSEMESHNSSGTVSSPYFPNNYPSKLQCVYTFIANPKRRVRLQFEEFILAGSAPKCGDYLDIYSELRDHNLDNLVQQQHSGRYCGSVSPRTRISLHQVIVLVFHARNDSRGEKGFSIKFDFIDEDKYEVYGKARPMQDPDCGFELFGTKGSPYTIYSPTYPGKYPANIKCKYLLKGTRGTRIKLSLKDFDLFFGGQHCPYDALTIYDGEDHYAPVVTRLCGLQQLVDVFSSGPSLYMEFFTVDPPFAEHRGFHIETTFSDDFVDLKHFLGGDPHIQHIPGTECDVRLTSAGETQHYIHSPRFPEPYPPKTICTYYLDGYQGASSLEKVHLTIVNFSISSQMPDDGITKCPLSNMTIDPSMLDDKSEGPASSGGGGDDDIGLCGDRPEIKWIDSEGPRMTVTFYAANETRKQRNIGFRAHIKFRTDFGIPGNHSGKSNDCVFTYTSSGNYVQDHFEYFNSPRYPDNYPLDITCIYHLVGRPGEVVRISFEDFDLSRGPDRANPNCNDYVRLYNVFDNGMEKPLGHYCYNNYPGPIVSHQNAHRVKVVFHSDQHSSATGFRASYEFLPTRPYPNETKPEGCSEFISGQTGGTFRSPGFSVTNDVKYTKSWICHWNITVRKHHQILLQPVNLKVEGGKEDDEQNCRAAVIRIHDSLLDVPDREWCGEKILPEMRDFLSKGNTVRVSFHTAPDKVNGMKGFLFSWTEVRTRRKGELADPPCNGPDQFRCKYTGYCISKDLVCNSLKNCGEGDHSDEMQCVTDESDKTLMTILIGAGSGIVVLLIIVTICVISKKKRRRSRMKEDRHSMIAQRMALNPTRASVSDDYHLYR